MLPSWYTFTVMFPYTPITVDFSTPAIFAWPEAFQTNNGYFLTSSICPLRFLYHLWLPALPLFGRRRLPVRLPQFRESLW